jgi:hypothetical protein
LHPRSSVVAVAFALAIMTAPGGAGAADYYSGKSIEMLIGAPAGGGYDIYARALARHLGRHIPGQPTIVPKNMPGAVMAPILDEKSEALFDPTKVLFLGTANNGTRICLSRAGSKIKTFVIPKDVVVRARQAINP